MSTRHRPRRLAAGLAVAAALALTGLVAPVAADDSVPTTTTIVAVRPSLVRAGDDIEVDVVVAPAPDSDRPHVSVRVDGIEGVDVSPAPHRPGTYVLDGVPAGTHALVAEFTGSDEMSPSTAAPVEVDVAATTDREIFVRRVYAKVLGRSGEYVGVEPLAHQIAIGAPRERIADAVTRSTEARRRLVDLVYRDALGRPADASGRAYWARQLLDGLRAEEFVASILTSYESLDRWGLSPNGTARMLYAYHLDRDADHGGLDYWTRRLAGARSPAAVRRIALAFGRGGEVTAAAVTRTAFRVCHTSTLSTTGRAGLAERFVATGRDPLRLVAATLTRVCPLAPAAP